MGRGRGCDWGLGLGRGQEGGGMGGKAVRCAWEVASISIHTKYNHSESNHTE